MALQLNESFSGIDCNYWKIVHAQSDYEMDKTIVTIALYKDQASRDADVHNILKKDFIRLDGCDYSCAQLYTKAKEPITVTQYGPDQNGDMTSQEVNTNKFVDAIDC